MTIKQDWENWRIACGNTKKLQNEVKELSIKMVKPCSPEEYWGNYIKKLGYGKFQQNLIPFFPQPTAILYWLKHKKKELERQAIELRASSCFYRLVYDRPGEPREETNLYDKCVFVRDGEHYDYGWCADCKHYDEMKGYIALQNNLEIAKAEQYKSRNALLQNFVFWKKRQK